MLPNSRPARSRPPLNFLCDLLHSNDSWRQAGLYHETQAAPKDDLFVQKLRRTCRKRSA